MRTAACWLVQQVRCARNKRILNRLKRRVKKIQRACVSAVDINHGITADAMCPASESSTKSVGVLEQFVACVVLLSPSRRIAIFQSVNPLSHEERESADDVMRSLYCT